MFYKELKRIIFNIPALMIILTALLVSLLFTYVSIHRYSEENSKVDGYYKEYVQELEGKLTREKIAYITEEKKFIDETIEIENEMLTKYNENDIDSEAYQQYLDDNFYAEEHSASIEKVNKQYKSILRLNGNGIPAHFIYDTGWNLYFDMRIAVFVQMIIVIALIINYVSGDYVSGMWKMTQTYLNGRARLLNIRMRAVLLLCAGVSSLFSIVYYIFFKTLFLMPDMEAPIQSINKFEKFPFAISIAAFLVLLAVFRIFALCLLGIFTYSVSSIVQNITAAFGICGIIIILPMIFSASSDIFVKLSFYELVLGTGIMGRSTSAGYIVIFAAGFALLSFFVYSMAVLKNSDLRRIKGK